MGSFVKKVFVLLSIFIFSVFSQEEKEEFFDLGEVVITGTKIEKKVEDMPFSISVIDREEIEKSGAQTLSDVLNFLPGIFVERTGDFGRTDPEIRGIGNRGRKIMVMIDGVPVKMGLFGCTVTHSLPIANIERIEVVRGGSSVLYGSDALGGVINIITREMKKEGFYTDVSISGGSYDTYQFLLNHGGKKGKFDYFFTVDRITSQGHRPQSEYKSADYMLKMGYEISKNTKVSLFLKNFHGKKWELGPEGGPILPDLPDDYRRDTHNLKILNKGKEHEFSLTFFHNFGHHKLKDGWHSRDHTYGSEIRYTTFTFVNNELTLGSDWQWFGGKRLNYAPDKWCRYQYSSYIWNEHEFENLIFTLGGRYSRDSISGGEFCPQGGFVYKFGNGNRVRANVSKAFRFPQLNELYMFPPSNTDLKPEKVLTYELGYNQRVNDWLTYDITGYYMDGEDLIQVVSGKFKNVGDFAFKGVEIGIEGKWENFKSTLYYSYLDPGNRTKGIAKNKLDLILNYKRDKFNILGTVQYVFDYYSGDNSTGKLSDYTVVNTRFSYEMNPYVELFLGIDNIFDEEYLVYVDLPGTAAGNYPMPGRTFTFGIKGKF